MDPRTLSVLMYLVFMIWRWIGASRCVCVCVCGEFECVVRVASLDWVSHEGGFRWCSCHTVMAAWFALYAMLLSCNSRVLPVAHLSSLSFAHVTSPSHTCCALVSSLSCFLLRS
jgi:hypothetical protein